MTGLERLGIGIIGCGEIAEATARSIPATVHAHIAAVMDTNAAMAQDLADRYGAPWTTDAADLLARPEVQAVYIAVPHYLHAALTIQAARAGKHVLCEKPIATTLADASAMIAACSQASVALSVAFDAQVLPVMTALRDLIAGGAIGTVLGTRIVALVDKPASYWESGWTGRVKTDWRLSREKAGGGVLIMNCIHDINTVRYVTGLEATRVYAEYGTFATPVEVEDYLVATVRYANGAVGHIEAGSCMRGGGADAGTGARIYGTEGQIVLSNPPRLYATRAVSEQPANTWQDIGTAREAYARSPIVEGFAAAVLEGRPPPVSGHDGRAALEVALAAYQSGHDGRPIELGMSVLADTPTPDMVRLHEGSPPAFAFQPLGYHGQ